MADSFGYFFLVFYRCHICPVILDFFSKTCTINLIYKVFLHTCTKHGIVIIRIIVIVVNHIAGIYILFYDSTDIICTGNGIALERRYHGTCLRDEGLAFVGGYQPVEEVLGCLLLLLGCLVTVINVEELGSAANNLAGVVILKVLRYRHNADVAGVVKVYDVVPFPASSELEWNAWFVLDTVKKHNEDRGWYDDDFIFLNIKTHKRTSTDALSTYIEKACKRSGIPVKRAHKIRKSFISSCIDHNINLDTVRRIVGHEDEKVTLHNYLYDRSDDQEILKQLEKIGEKKPGVTSLKK